LETLEAIPQHRSAHTKKTDDTRVEVSNAAEVQSTHFAEERTDDHELDKHAFPLPHIGRYPSGFDFAPMRYDILDEDCAT